MNQILHDVTKEEFCRLPIDMYLAKNGPWYGIYGESDEVVQHIGTRYHID